jgi:hypothetical protein
MRKERLHLVHIMQMHPTFGRLPLIINSQERASGSFLLVSKTSCDKYTMPARLWRGILIEAIDQKAKTDS